MAEKKSWRDVIKVHPAADVFPMLPEDELRTLGKDIEKNGLKEPIILWSPGAAKRNEDPKTKGSRSYLNEVYLLDGRNRLSAIDLCGLDVRYSEDKVWMRVYREGGQSGCGNEISCHLFESTEGFDIYDDGKGGMSKPEITKRVDPYLYVISKNIRRRHLTKEQQADLIIKVMKASESVPPRTAVSPRKDDLATMARSFSPISGRRGGSTSDPIKEKAVEEAAKHGISKRTIERVIAKDRGPTLLVQKPHRKQKPPVSNIEVVVKKIMAFIDRNLTDKSHESLTSLSEHLTAAIQHRMHAAPRELSRPEIKGKWETIGR